MKKDIKLSKRKKFMKDIKVEADELTLEELEKVTAGIPDKDNVKEEAESEFHGL